MNLIFLLLLSQLAAEPLSKFNDLLIGADRAVRRGDQVELTGNVQLIFQNQHLAADHAKVNLSTKDIRAQGQVVLKNMTTTIEAQEIAWNYATNTGLIYNGFIQSGQVLFEGNVIEKTGEQEYVANNATYTACNTCPPGWGFSGSRIDAEIGGYAYIHNTVLRFAGVPVFWSPYMIVPLKSTRQTGLLPPSFDYQGSSGLAYNQRLFWAISRSQDATFATKIYQKRGVKGLFNYRYVLTPDSSGELNTGYLKDPIFARDPVFGPDRLNSDPGWAVDRWFLRYNHQYVLPGDFIHKTSLNLTRDLRYPRDFPDDMPTQGDPALDNRMSLTQNKERQHLSLDSSYYVNLLQENPLADNRQSVHRLPEIRYSLTERAVPWTPFVYNIDTKYSNFAREGLAHDNVTRTGCDEDRCLSSSDDPVFNADRDLIRTGQRLTIQPSLALPLHAGPYIDLVPRSTLVYNQYAFSPDPLPKDEFNSHPSLVYVRNTVSARTRFSRIFGNLTDSKATRWKHSFEPEIVYSTVPYLRKSNHSFFGPLTEIPSYRREEPITDRDFASLDPSSSTGIQFDYNDRIFDRNVAGVVLRNFLTRKVVRGDTAEYQRIAQLSVSQDYDYDEDRKGADRRRPWGALKTLLDVRLEHFNTNTFVQYYPYHQVADIAARLMINDNSKFVQTTYTKKFKITEKIPADSSDRTETLGLSAGYNHKFAHFKAGINYSLVTRDIQTWEYALDLKPPGNCMVVQLGLSQGVTGQETYRISFDFKFDGQG